MSSRDLAPSLLAFTTVNKESSLYYNGYSCAHYLVQ